jgi:hypothetical protein
VRTLASEDVRIDVSERLTPALVRLAHGLPDGGASEDDDALLALLARDELAADGLPDDDPIVTAALATLGRGLAWRTDDDGREIADYLRRQHARRKSSFLDFWQGPCVPECGAHRVQRVLDIVPPNGRVFLVGDDDLLTLPLARAGLRVTTIDIDDTLIALLRALAAEQGLAIDARVLDLCEPLPEELVSTCDAALTDPQSSPAPMRAFASRALAAVKEGGHLFISVHDQFRRGFSALSRELPARPVSAHLGFGSYYTHGWEADPYRSDFLVLERTAGDLPFAPSEHIPAQTFMGEEIAASDHHALGNARVMTLKSAGWLDTEQLARDLRASPHIEVEDTRVTAFEGGAALLATLAGGGHVTVRCDVARKQVGWAIAPLAAGAEEALVHALTQQVRFAKRDGLRGVPPHVGAPGYRFTQRG